MKSKSYLTPEQVQASFLCYHNLFDAYTILEDALYNLRSCCSRTPFTQSLENKLIVARDKVKKLDKLYLQWIQEYTSGTF